jgi:nucleotide-binding universal stress UspA family protein
MTTMYSRILVPIDGSAEAHEGLKIACLIAEHHKARVILLCVSDGHLSEEAVEAAINEGIVRPSSYQEFVSSLDYPSIASTQAELNREAILSRTASAIAQTIVEREAGFAKGQSVPEVLTLLRSGRSDGCILDVASEYRADLIVLGSHGHQGIESLFHSSVAESVRKQATCPCLILYPSVGS